MPILSYRGQSEVTTIIRAEPGRQPGAKQQAVRMRLCFPAELPILQQLHMNPEMGETRMNAELRRRTDEVVSRLAQLKDSL
jgi:hypothetical protein